MKEELILKKVDESNFIDCFNLKLGQGQDKFVYYNQCTPFTIYNDNIIVGYVWN